MFCSVYYYYFYYSSLSSSFYFLSLFFIFPALFHILFPISTHRSPFFVLSFPCLHTFSFSFALIKNSCINLDPFRLLSAVSSLGFSTIHFPCSLLPALPHSPPHFTSPFPSSSFYCLTIFY